MKPKAYESVAVSSRIRLARNFAEYPFPGRLIGDPRGEETAREIVRLVSAQIMPLESFLWYDMSSVSAERAEYLAERNLISRALIGNRRISSAFISRDESISVMINEEDHIREQYFIDGLDLTRAFERISGIDDVISYTVPFAYDEKLGYLTACPTNLGTGLRASVMLFLPALSRGGRMKEIAAKLKQLGLTVRGAFGEGSGADGDLFQISNEVTLGVTEEEILSVVEENVDRLVEDELTERARLKREGGLALSDRLLRSYGILTNCLKIGAEEFIRLMTDIKLAVALGILDGTMEELDNLMIAMRPANLSMLNGVPLGGEEKDVFRAAYAGGKLRAMGMLTDQKRNDLSPRG